jgi:hypothetical protein
MLQSEKEAVSEEKSTSRRLNQENYNFTLTGHGPRLRVRSTFFRRAPDQQ